MGSEFFSTNTRPTLLERVQCDGTEETLRQCTLTLSSDGECTHDAAVVCQSKNCSLFVFTRY